ncbi:MAG: sigma-70 family RNA polymerase sigma factor [Chloroflexi bacterium]|nr:sigma-70 family RNA polymerase sigma factor [Chloroflexota bacterium]
MDSNLVGEARHGDQEAFIALIRPRSNRLLAIAHRILRDFDRAEDAVQDALEIAWRDLPGLRDPDRFDAWLRKLLVRVCIGQATRERRRSANLRLLPINGPAAPDDLAGIADRDQLERGFRRLAPDQRAILVLHHFEGYGPAEIADVLGIPAGTARSRLHFAHRAMRAALEADARVAVAQGLST